MKRRLLMLRIRKADAEQVKEALTWGADAKSCTKHGTPAVVRAVRNRVVMADVVKVLLDHGADPNALDRHGLTALDYARRRLIRYQGRPLRKPRRSPSLTQGGELKLSPAESRYIDQLDALSPGAGDDYIRERRRAAEKVLDNRANLERVVALLEAAV